MSRRKKIVSSPGYTPHGGAVAPPPTPPATTYGGKPIQYIPPSRPYGSWSGGSYGGSSSYSSSFYQSGFNDDMYDEEGRFIGGSRSTRTRRTEVDRYVSGFDAWDRDYDGPISSASRHVYGFGSYQGYFGGGSNPAADATKRASYHVARLANAVRNSNKKEKPISLRWADKKNEENGNPQLNRNDPSSGDIVLDPELVYKDGKDLSGDPNVLDGVGGKVLLASAMKKTVSSKAVKHMLTAESGPKPPADAPTSRSVFEAAETSIARDKLLTEWPGAAPYLARHAQISGVATHAEVQAAYDSNPRALPVATAAAQWNILHPGNPVKVSPELDAVITKAESVMTCDPKDRYVESTKIAKEIMALCDPPDPSGSPPGGDGNGGGNGPVVSDGSLFVRQLGSVGGVGPESGQDQVELFGGKALPNDAFIPSGVPNAQPPTWQTAKRHAGANGCNSKDAVFKKRFLDLRRTVTPMSREISKYLSFRKDQPAWPVRGVSSGDLDDGALDKLAARRDVSPNIWERHEIVAAPSVAVGILIDQSGSMSCDGQNSITGKPTRRVELAKMVAVALSDALRKVRGIHVMIASHYTGGGRITLVDLLGMESPQSDEHWMSIIDARGANADSFAAQDMVKRMTKYDTTAKHRVLFVVSDGEPSSEIIDRAGGCHSYGGEPAAKHMREVVLWSKRVHATEVYGIGIDGSPGQAFGDLMYGKGRFVCLEDTLSSARVIGQFVAKVAARM